ncbi:hypothetical protein RF11_05640 [Thelohanellus kitauei]|uniref:Uncharacterized protein n=1 Tax=Thelohanellus kitauei TaxID=669202 RepID=A0A0C2MDY2_THEKT|nr:hypothetical protein RF11_05640 [Thelohanellus kitauei]
MVRLVDSDCIGQDGIKYPIGELLRVRDISNCDLCYCGKDSCWKCDKYTSCKDLKCINSKSVVRDCCLELKCEVFDNKRAKELIIFGIVLCGVVCVIILLLLGLASYCCWRTRSHKREYHIELHDVILEGYMSNRIYAESIVLSENPLKEQKNPTTTGHQDNLHDLRM